ISLTEANLRFVPGEFINALGHHDIDEVALGDTVQKEMTVLFSDMREFTRHVEGMSPVENIAFINEYLAQLEPAVIAHGGFVDSYIGDAVMALFEGSCAEAVAAGVAMQRSLAPLNERRRARGRRPITMGVGLNTGELTLGTIGGPRRIKCGVIGDAVNLAARIESLTKSYGAAVLVGEATLAKVEPGRFSVREVDRVRVVGRLAPVTMYEVLDALPDARREAIERTLGDWREAVEAYREGRLEEALAGFGRCRAAVPDDPVIRLRHQRCERYLKARPKGEWSEVEELTHK
ncbi:MAG: adenylate/guanylate cyclase domain-containing protein, partial [Polyangiales bacterium]